MLRDVLHLAIVMKTRGLTMICEVRRDGCQSLDSTVLFCDPLREIPDSPRYGRSFSVPDIAFSDGESGMAKEEENVTCAICLAPTSLEDCNFDRDGHPVHYECYADQLVLNAAVSPKKVILEYIRGMSRMIVRMARSH